MPTRTVFNDTDNNEMECYLNDTGKLFISVSQTGEHQQYAEFITLNKEDVQKLIEVLTEIEADMED